MGSPSAGTADLHAEVFIGAFLPFERGKGTFAATTSTLVSGASDAVLIDAQHIRSDVAALGDLIERTGRRLTTIYATHGLDHPNSSKIKSLGPSAISFGPGVIVSAAVGVGRAGDEAV